jgi:hypothetical protein
MREAVVARSSCQYLHFCTSKASKLSSSAQQHSDVVARRCQQVSALLQVSVLAAHSKCQQVSALLQVSGLVARSSSGVSICTFVAKRVHVLEVGKKKEGQ